MNNDFITFGRLSEAYNSQQFYQDSNSTSLIRNRNLDLNFDNGRFGYELDVSYMSFSTKRVADSVTPGGASITAYWGNGAFIEGVWENGVWNNGPRTNQAFNTNSVSVNMESVSNFFQTAPNRWQVELSGLEDISIFSVGDYISIGNIIGLTVNETRKFLKDSYQIIKIDTLLNTLSVVIITPFPIRAIQKDSDNHKILVTKNVWENGKFHNGTFEGVWNSGIFEGYPYLSVIQDTQWISGKLDGGRFISSTQSDVFGNTYSTGLMQDAVINARNSFGNDIFETWMDVNYSGDYYSYLWSNDGLPPSPIESTRDVLTSTTNIWKGVVNDPSTRKFNSLKLGDRINLYDELIQDDLNGIFPGQTLESRGWSFSRVPAFLVDEFLSVTQSKFLGYYDGYLLPSDNMSIDLTLSPTFSASDKYAIRHNNLSNLTKDRYWEISYDIVSIDPGNGPDAYVSPYPIAEVPFYEGFTLKAYHWNILSDTPIIVTGLTAIVNIDNITFTEVDYIPFPNYWGNNIFNIDGTLKSPKFTESESLEYSERDAKFIDNKNISK